MSKRIVIPSKMNFPELIEKHLAIERKKILLEAKEQLLKVRAELGLDKNGRRKK